MKKLLSSVALACAATAGSASPLLVSFSPVPAHVAVGATIDIQVTLSGLVGDEVLTTAQMGFVLTNPAGAFSGADFAALSGQLGGGPTGSCWAPSFGDQTCIDYSDTTFLGPMTLPGNNVGVVAWSFLDDDSVRAAQTDGSFLLGTLSLKGVQSGLTYLTTTGFLMTGANAAEMQVQTSRLCVAVGDASCDQQPVPEPASYGLAALALLAAGASRRKLRRGR